MLFNSKGAWLWRKKHGYEGGSSGGGGTTTSVQQNFSPEEAAKRAQVMDEAKGIYDATKGTITNSPYPGAKVAPFSPETDAAQRYLTDYAQGGAADMANSISSGVKFGLGDVLNPNSNSSLQDYIKAAVRPITESYVDPGGVMSQIRTDAMNNGQFGGTRQGVAEGIAAGRYANAIGDTTAKITNDAYGKGLDTFARTLAFAPQAIQAGMSPADMLSAVGAQKEGLTQAQNEYDAQANMWKLNAPWAPLQNYASIVYGGASPSTTSTQNVATGGRSALGGMLGGAAQGFAMSGGNPWGAAAGAILSMF